MKENLVKKLKNGDRKAQQDIYKELFKPLFHFLRHRCRTNEDAEDIVSESFIKAFKNIEGFNEDSSFKTWLYTIAKNTMLDFYRKKSNSVNKIAIDDKEEFITFEEEDIENDEATKEINMILGKLKNNYREVLELRYLMKCSIKETAEIMGITEGNVKVLQNRALKKANSNNK